MSQKKPGPQRSIQPREGWENIFTAQEMGEAQFSQGYVFEASYQNRPILRLVYNPKDHETTGKAVVTVRCVLCGLQSRALDSFQDYPMIGSVEANAIRALLTMNTARILKHLATVHDVHLGGVDDLDFFNCILDCCNL